MRSPTFERAMLEEVARRAGRWGKDVEDYVDAVQERMRLGESEYEADNPALARPLAELLGEMGEEGADLGGWGLLAAQKLHALQLDGLNEDEAAEIQTLIIAAAANGMMASVQVQEAKRKLRTARAHVGWQEKVAPVGCVE